MERCIGRGIHQILRNDGGGSQEDERTMTRHAHSKEAQDTRQEERQDKEQVEHRGSEVSQASEEE